MKTIIAGSRFITNRQYVFACIEAAIADGLQITEVISGGAVGVDKLAVAWAKARGIPYREIPITRAEWDFYGKRAGAVRNATMARIGDALIAIHGRNQNDEFSKGTADMIKRMREAGKKVVVFQKCKAGA